MRINTKQLIEELLSLRDGDDDDLGVLLKRAATKLGNLERSNGKLQKEVARLRKMLFHMRKDRRNT